MNDCENCGGVGWILVERPDRDSFVKVCDCRRAQKADSAPRRTILAPETAALAVEGLCEILDYAPKTEIGKAIITNALLSMCSTVEQVTWLVQRACMLHTNWRTCGIPGLRQILCSKYAPKDGIEVSSTKAFPDGVPSEQPRRVAPAPAVLPRGHAASANPSLDAAVQELTEAKRPPSPR